MANDLTHNPWSIDTASASALSTDTLHVRELRWTGATTAGHAAIVQDRWGRHKWSSVAAGANYVEADHVESKELWDGLLVPTLQSGTLYVYFL